VTDLYADPSERITYSVVRSFVLDAEAANAATESRTVEFKSRLSKSNVAEAVAALANADGGLVFVGVDEKLRGETRLVGVATSEVDAIVNSLRSLLPHDAFPEVVPVAVDAERVIVLLRVDADVAIQPVVVGGRVLVRYPGQSVPVDRAQIAALVARGARAPDEEAYNLPMLPLDGRASDLFGGEAPFAFELRLIGSVTLPHRSLHRSWLDSPARAAVRAALTASPLPDRLWYDRPFSHGRADYVWVENDARSTWVRYGTTTPPLTQNGDDLDPVGAAYVTLNGRVVRTLVGVGFRLPATARERSGHVSMTELYYGLLGLLMAHSAVTRAVAEALDATEPVRVGAREAWLLPGKGLTVTDITMLNEYGPRGPGGSEQWLHFRPAVAGNALTDFEALTRMWVETALLDAGARNFEPYLAEVPRPTWATEPRAGDA
jgi:hypothetical protein